MLCRTQLYALTGSSQTVSCSTPRQTARTLSLPAQLVYPPSLPPMLTLWKRQKKPRASGVDGGVVVRLTTQPAPQPFPPAPYISVDTADVQAKLFDNIAEQYDKRQRLCLVEMCTNHKPFIEDLSILGKANADETTKEPGNETTNQPSNQAKACHIQSQSHNKPSQPASQPTKASHNQTQPHPASASHVYSVSHAKSHPWSESGSGSVVMRCLNPRKCFQRCSEKASHRRTNKQT